MRVPQTFLLHAHYQHPPKLVSASFRLSLLTVYEEFLCFDTPSDVLTMANTGFAASFWSQDYAGGKLCGAAGVAIVADHKQA